MATRLPARSGLSTARSAAIKVSRRRRTVLNLEMKAVGPLAILLLQVEKKLVDTLIQLGLQQELVVLVQGSKDLKPAILLPEFSHRKVFGARALFGSRNAKRHSVMPACCKTT